MLIPQTYGEDWANRFWVDIAPFLNDPRYIRVNGAPMLVIYRLGEIPNATDAIDVWRKRAADEGHPALHLLAVVPSREIEELDSDVLEAIDGLVDFPPGSNIRLRSLISRLAPHEQLQGDFMSYRSATITGHASDRDRYRRHAGIMPGWDNTARRGAAAYGFIGSSPVTWRRTMAVPATGTTMASGRMLFINAWNEWEEGASIEPNQRFAVGRLASISDATGTVC